MRRKTTLFTVFFALFCVSAANSASFPEAPKPFSPYGQIQNVPNYSSNPFWNPNGPYNQRMPQPVYVQGTDVDTGDCQRVVNAIVASYCQTRNNCMSESLSDARPTLIIQLSNIPNHDFVTACSGFIDEAFSNYKKANSIAAPKSQAAFPTGTVANPSVNQQNQIQMKNPFEQSAPDWAKEMKEREQELKDLQAQNGAGNTNIAKADFPTTIGDYSFQERIQNAQAGYEPYKNAKAYKTINIQMGPDTTAEKCALMEQELQKIRNTISTLKECLAKNIPISQCNYQGY